MPPIEVLNAARAWNGLAPAVERAPLLDVVPSLPGFFTVVMSNGYMLAPVVGRMTADAVLGRKSNPASFPLARFG